MLVKSMVTTAAVGVLVVAALLVAPLSASAATLFVSNTNDSGQGSLRQAILTANSSAGSHVISFSIGSGHVSISPTSPLPPITQPVMLDGSTQPGYSGVPLIEITGAGAGGGARGLYVTGAAAGSTIRGLVINRFTAQGIFIDTSNVSVQNNYVGLTSDGHSSAGNSGDGVAVFSGTSAASANGNVIGGTTASTRNVISGNGGNGIGITAQDGGTANNTSVQGNFVGTDVNGTGSIGNGGDGILVNNATGAGTITGTVLGGTLGTSPNGACTGACNLVSANGANGIGLWHGGVTGSTVAGNFVGTDVSGTTRLGNSNIGVEVNETANNIVGGTIAGTRNILSANGGAGVFLTGAGATGNQVEGNYIGTNAAGTRGLGNVKMGVGVGSSPGAIGAHSDTIGGSAGATIGGPCTGACNVISGNGQNGIFITGSESYGHVIAGNFIGLDASGAYGIGNQIDGIGLLSAPNIRVGGSAPERNLISSNGGNGVIVVGGSATGTSISFNAIGENTRGGSSGNVGSGISIVDAVYAVMVANSIGYNGGLGIDLNGGGIPILNDDGDADGGANHQQNFPMVYAARTTANVTKVGGELNSTPSSNFRLDFFQSDSCNAGAPYDYGEGQIWLGSKEVNTDQFGNTAFGFTAPSPIAGNKYITATASREAGGQPIETSEFSQCVLVNASKPALTNGATWFLKIGLTSGSADHTFGYGFPSYFLMCAWDPNQPGVKLPVIYTGGTWLMRASYTTGTADLTFTYGDGSQRPVCGDWNGDGIDSPGLVDSGLHWSLRNSNSSGPADAGQFQFGSPNSSPVVGDWNGDGTDTVGSVTSDETWSLRNSNDAGAADAGQFQFGTVGTTPIVADWDGNGIDTVGIVASDGVWTIRNSNSSGPSDGSFTYGFSGASPLMW